jgi:hypothetical protein
MRTFPKKDDILIFNGVPEFYYPHFTDMKAEADEHLILGQTYVIEEAIVNSSWVSIHLKDTYNPSVGWNLKFFIEL